MKSCEGNASYRWKLYCHVKVMFIIAFDIINSLIYCLFAVMLLESFQAVVQLAASAFFFHLKKKKYIYIYTLSKLFYNVFS